MQSVWASIILFTLPNFFDSVHRSSKRVSEKSCIRLKAYAQAFAKTKAESIVQGLVAFCRICGGQALKRVQKGSTDPSIGLKMKLKPVNRRIFQIINKY